MVEVTGFEFAPVRFCEKQNPDFSGFFTVFVFLENIKMKLKLTKY